MLFERRSLSRRLEILEADLALDALREDVLYICVSALGMGRHGVFPGQDWEQARGAFAKAKKKKRTDLSWDLATFPASLALRSRFEAAFAPLPMIAMWYV
jgi:hypothetical protein